MSAGFVIRVRRLGTAISLVVLACICSPATALAGGPTSALLVSPSTGQTAALYNSDPEYDQLMTLLEEPATSTNPGDADPAPSVAADYVTVTWLLHDVTVWRIDRIFLAGPAGEPWIVTQTENGDPAASAVPPGSGMFPGERGNDSAVWHRSTDPAELVALLGELGLLSADGNTAVSDSAAAPTAAAALDPPAVTAGAWWAIAGLLVGAALMALALRYLPAARRRLLGDENAHDPVDQPRRMVEVQG